MTKKPLFILLADLAKKDRLPPLNTLPACWERQIGERWWVAINGHTEPKPQSHSDQPVEAYHAYVEFNGWPAGLFTPFGGQFAAGDAANEEAFAKAIEEEIGYP